MNFGGLIYQHIPTEISDQFERPTLRGCPFVADYGRVVASLQHLPCQETKPKGLRHGSELCRFGLICVFTRLYVDGFERPTLWGCTLWRTSAGLSLRSNTCPAKRPTLWGCFVLNTLHITLICLMRNGGCYGYFIMIQSCNLPLHTSSSAKSTPLSPTQREAA